MEAQGSESSEPAGPKRWLDDPGTPVYLLLLLVDGLGDRLQVTHELLGGACHDVSSLTRARERIREITRRNRGIRLERMISELNRFQRGWVTYFRHASAKVTLSVWTSGSEGSCAVCG